jgi:hypothetical protein
MPTLQEILRDPNYVNANPATKRAIFERWAPQDSNYTGANGATQAAIRERFGVGGAQALGAPTPITTPAPAPEEESGFFRQALDVPVGLAKGAVQGVRMVADAFGAGSDTSNTIRGVEDYIGGLMSAESKKDSREIARIMQEAEDKGVGDQLKAALSAFVTAPVDLISQGLGTAAPVILAGLGSKVLGAGAAVVRGVGLGLGATMGAGTSKGVIYEETKQALKESGLSEEQAEARAQIAQSYGGENLDMILAGTALGGLGAVTGIEKPVAAALARRIMGKAAATEATEKVATEGAEAAAQQGIARRYGTAIAAEGAPEFAQGAQEQLAGNVALQREGFDVDTMRGVVGAGALEGLVGAGMGAGVEAVTGGERPAPPTTPADTTATTTGTTEEIETPADTEEETISIADALNPPPPPTKEEIALTALTELQGEIEGLTTKITDMETRGASLSKGEKTALQNLRRQKKAKEKKLNELQAAEVTPPAPPITPPAPPVIETPTPGEPLGTTTTQAQQTETQGQTAPDAGTAVTPADTGTKRATKLDKDDSFLDSLLGDDGLPSRGTAALTPEQAKQEEKLNAIGADYGLQRREGEGVQAFASRLKAVITDRRVAEQEFARRIEGGEPISAIETELLDKQSLIGKKPMQIAPEQQGMYEEMREEFNQSVEEEGQTLPAFDKLTPDEKVMYFTDNIARNSYSEHQQAARKLADYLEAKREEAESATRTATKAGATEAESRTGVQDARDLVRAQTSYQRERDTFSRKGGIAYQLPMWGDLSEDSKRAYAAINKTDTVLEQDRAFRAVKKQVQKETSERQSREGLEESERRATQQMEAAAERARASQPAGKGAILPLNVLKMLGRGDIKGVLNYLNRDGRGLETKTARLLGQGKVKIRDTVAQKIFRALAGALANVEGLKVNVVFDQNMIYDQIARYDANTNTLYVGPNGLDEATILHELVHAATVKIIHQYFTDPSKLDARQRAAVEQIQKIAAYAKAALGNKYPNAFENLYEFVAYAMTDMDFQNQLARIQVPGVAVVTAKTPEQRKQLEEAAVEGEAERGLGLATEPTMLFDSLWDAFTGTLAWMYKLFRPEQTQTKILLPTEKTRVGKRAEATKKIAPVESAEQRRLSEQEREALAPETLFDNPEAEANEAVIPPEPGEMVTERGVTNLQRAILREPGYKGNLLLEAAAAVQAILAAPEGGIEALAGKESVSSELYATQPKQTKQAQDLSPTTTSLEQAIKNNALPETSTMSALKRMFTTRQAYLTLRKKYQNSRDVLKRTEIAAELAEKIEYAGSKINAVYTAIIGSSGIARNYYLSKVEPHEYALRKAVGKYAEKMGVSVEDAVVRLHLIGLALHDGERRDVLYMFNVPLSTKPTNITLLDADGQPSGTVLNMAPSEFRIKVMEAVFGGKLKKTDLEALRKTLDSVVQNKTLRDPFGFSGIDRETGGVLLTPNPATPYTQEQLDNLIDRNSARYNTGGKYSPTELADYKAQLYTDENKAVVDEVMEAMQLLQKSTTELNKEANYWSKPVQSVVDFYGWKNYIPLKGKQHFETSERILNYDTVRSGRDFQEAQDAVDGRQTDSDNSVLQTMVDATRAALRAGRADVTLSILNAVNDGIIQGEVLPGKIEFADRRSISNLTIKNKKGDDVRVTGENFIYHYNKDGSIQIIQLTNQEQRQAIKRTYEAANPLIDKLNLVTSTIGQLHTRYNLAFAPMNFVRDALTHAFMLGADFGPKAAAQYITAIAVKVATGGLNTTRKISVLYEKGQLDTIEQMAKKDPYIASIYEYLKAGGKISYLSGISSKSQQLQLQEDLSSSKLKTAKAAVDKLFDVYNDMFELAARAAAYQIAKEQAIAEAKRKNPNMTPKELAEADKAARKKAMGYAKELANFESVGEWGKGAGAMFMFFRPAATGAVRAIDAISPLFKGSLERAKADLPPAIRENAEAMAAFEKNFAKRAKSAKAMSLGLVGMGAAMYIMAYMMADDDEYGRNKVATDDMNRWQRYARFYIPGTEDALKGNAFQVPWGFGLGAFASMGSQLAALAMGNNSVKDTLTNTFLVGMDSFLPLPVSKISPMEHPAAWLMDSAMPSSLRPFLEWTMNLDGLGREIYNNRSSRYSDAYTGGDNIPELYKSAARTLYDATNGAVDWSPNTMFFFANNYMDGIARLASGTINIAMVATDDKNFNPKNDTLFFDSFFGTPSNVDAREFAKAEEKILDIKKKLDSMKEFRPEQYAKYVEKNPMHPFIVESYNVKVNQVLRDLRKEANVYRRMPGLTPKERTDIVKNYVSMQNLVKRDILNTLEAYGLED